MKTGCLKQLFLSSLIVISLSACNGGSDSDDDITDGSGSVDNVTGVTGEPSAVSLAGDDVGALGASADFNFYAYRENITGASHFLAATSSASALNFVRLGLGELSESDVNLSEVLTDQTSAVVFNITDIGVSIRINKSGKSYLYSIGCVTGCVGVQFDPSARQVHLNNVVLEPTIGGDADSLATNELTLNGTIEWAAADENPAAPAIATGGSTGGDAGDSSGGTGGSGGTNSALAGNWNLTTDEGEEGIDEAYWVIGSDLRVTLYDYDGDSFDMGDNCYYTNEGQLVHKGGNTYEINWESNGIFVESSFTLSIAQSGDNLLINGLVIVPSTIPVSSYSPEC